MIAYWTCTSTLRRRVPPTRRGSRGTCPTCKSRCSAKRPPALGLAPVALPFAAFEAYLDILRQSEPFMPIVRLMLLLGDNRLRDLARDALLPVLAAKLRGANVAADDIYHALEEACLGADMIDERLRLCQRLPALGVDAALVSACTARLQDERLVRCSECAASVRSKDIETHLRGPTRFTSSAASGAPTRRRATRCCAPSARRRRT